MTCFSLNILCHECMVEFCTNSNLFRRKIDLKFKSYIMPVLPCMKSPKTTPHRFSRVCRWEITFVRCLSLTFFLNEKKWIIVYRSKDVGKLFNVRHITSWGWKQNETGRHLMVRLNENYNRLMRNYMLIILFCVWIITEIWSSFKYFECMPSIEK